MNGRNSGTSRRWARTGSSTPNLVLTSPGCTAFAVTPVSDRRGASASVNMTLVSVDWLSAPEPEYSRSPGRSSKSSRPMACAFQAVVVHGGGYAAPRLGAIPWINTGRVIYWGDLDSDGFTILHALRSGCDNVTSTLMDEATLLQFRDLWVPEPKAAGGTYSTLTAGEQTALGRIRSEGNVRREQERIDWTYALPRLLTLATNPS
ncbi:Wadjet anti-phage system protein JetD domain-containing protein [Cryobacterium sp. M91]|uniref:Wadjet anti-phage system protein JetD domain-containing protein n=1 Tax=Cryobacterium sp. M91 TaxID=2048294 RepID=UPI000CE56DF4|nr:Wadjet anti-phage system protein JetD domain-containing protein [Cryobacterium sp. M91]